MKKLLVFVLLLAVARSEKDLEKYEGYWTGVMLFSDLVISNGCDILKFEKTDEFCKCGQEQVKLLALSSPEDPNEKNKFPVIPVDSAEDFSDAMATSCKCDGKDIPHLVFFPHGNKYLSMHTVGYGGVGEGGDVLILLAKNVSETAKPSVKELENIVEHAVDLKDKDGTIICSSDGPTEDKSKKASGSSTKKWYQLKH